MSNLTIFIDYKTGEKLFDQSGTLYNAQKGDVFFKLNLLYKIVHRRIDEFTATSVVRTYEVKIISKNFEDVSNTDIAKDSSGRSYHIIDKGTIAEFLRKYADYPTKEDCEHKNILSDLQKIKDAGYFPNGNVLLVQWFKEYYTVKVYGSDGVWVTEKE